MFIIDDIIRQMDAQESMFETQLLREDLARLEKLNELLETAVDINDFVKTGMVIGWTKGDMRTFELKDELENFLKAFYKFQKDNGSEEDTLSSWNELNQTRRKVLLHCL